MIYLILSAGFKDNNPDQFEKRLKIGYTDNLENRLKANLTTNPDFMLLQTREGDTSLESYLHKKFEKYRYKDSKEWFYYNQEIIDHFQDEVEDFVDEGILLECIKKDLRSKIASVSELRRKYLNQILDEIKSLDEFNEELYDEEVIISRIVSIWKEEIIRFNKSIDDIKLLNYSPIDILKLTDQDIYLDVDISQDLPQILGRQKLFDNPWKNQATFYYKLTCDYRKTPRERFDDSLREKIQKSKNLLSVYEKGHEDERKSLAKKYLRVADVDNYKDDFIAVNTHGGTCMKPVFNNLVYVSELRAYDIQQVDYKDRFSVFCTINANLSQSDITNLELEQFFSEYEELKTFHDKLKYICEYPFSNELLFKAVVDQVDMELQSAIYGLGKKKLRALNYNTTYIKKELGVVLFSETDLGNHIRSTFKIGDRYTLSDLKEKLRELYTKIGYKATPKANDILEYFEVKEFMITQIIEGEKKRVKGYELLSYKKL